jgi:hypothetical protein
MDCRRTERVRWVTNHSQDIESALYPAAGAYPMYLSAIRHARLSSRQGKRYEMGNMAAERKIDTASGQARRGQLGSPSPRLLFHIAGEQGRAANNATLGESSRSTQAYRGNRNLHGNDRRRYAVAREPKALPWPLLCLATNGEATANGCKSGVLMPRDLMRLMLMQDSWKHLDKASETICQYAAASIKCTF